MVHRRDRAWGGGSCIPAARRSPSAGHSDPDADSMCRCSRLVFMTPRRASRPKQGAGPALIVVYLAAIALILLAPADRGGAGLASFCAGSQRNISANVRSGR